MKLFDGIARSALFTLDPETAHGLSIAALKSRLVPGCRADHDPRLAVTVAGLAFPNPLGMAAGYDKNAEVASELARLGFGFVEVGTLTPRPQSGNPKPRIFRLVKDHAVINRLGFNNQGHAVAHARISGRHREGLLGINIGANKDSDDRIADYVLGLERLSAYADYLVVNVSSPNTPELRKLQEPERLARLIETLLSTNRRLALQRRTQPKPLLVKIAPDLTDAEVTEIACLALSLGVSGLIATNTTIARPATLRTAIEQEGGLSGKPLAQRALEVLRLLFRAVEGKLPLIGVGGIFSAEDAYARLRAGASLVQLYTGLIYEGPFLPRRIVRGLRMRLRQNGLSHIRDAVGTDA